jgi:hypothetical protein
VVLLEPRCQDTRSRIAEWRNEFDPGHKIPDDDIMIETYTVWAETDGLRYVDPMKPAVSWSEALFARTQPGERARRRLMIGCEVAGLYLLFASIIERSSLWGRNAAIWLPIGAILTLASIVQFVAMIRRRRGWVGKHSN